MAFAPPCLLVLLLWVGPSLAFCAERPEPDLRVGRAAYLQHCARCHGIAGQGDGRDAPRFYPRPRDLTAGVYKFRSTASGSSPTDDDLFQTLTRGLPGSNMPDWQHLDEATRWQLVEYLKSLSPRFQELPPQPVTMVPDPGPKGVDLAKGNALYEQLGCAACHGSSGRANGPSASTLTDDWGLSIRPANLTQGWNYRGWSDARSILQRLLTGIDGTPMPSYAEAVSPEDAWPLAYYVASLQEPVQWNMVVRATRLPGELPATPDDPRWEEAERTDVRLRNAVTPEGEWAAPSSVSAVSLRVVAHEAMVAFRVSWDDPTHDGMEGSADAFALVLQPETSRGDVVTLQAWPYRGGPALDVGYWSADVGQAYETMAADFDSVRARRLRQSLLTSAARYEDGRWHLVIQRPRVRTSLEGAARIASDRSSPVAFAVWDGGNPDARAVSPWIDLDTTEEE